MLPLLVPGIAGGTNIVFALAMSAYVTPAVLGPSGPNFITTLIYQHFVTLFDWPTGSALAVVLFIMSMTVIALYSVFLARLASERLERDDGHCASPVRDFASCFLAAPTFVVLVTSFGRNATLEFPPSSWSLVWYGRALARTEFQSAAFNSFWIAVITTLMATPIALAAALAIVRGKFPAGKLQVFLLSPLVVPSIVIGLAILIFAAALEVRVVEERLVAAHVLITFPYLVRTIIASLSRIDPLAEEAARTLGQMPSSRSGTSPCRRCCRALLPECCSHSSCLSTTCLSRCFWPAREQRHCRFRSSATSRPTSIRRSPLFPHFS